MNQMLRIRKNRHDEFLKKKIAPGNAAGLNRGCQGDQGPLIQRLFTRTWEKMKHNNCF
jgi:hypothetical protein